MGSIKKIIVLGAALSCLSAYADWKYSDLTDAMTSKKTKLASQVSINTLSLSRPYQGENFGRIFVRQHPTEGLDVLLTVDKGQIICNNYNGCNVSVRFDDSPPVQFSAGGTTDHSSTTLFLKNEKKFIASASKANRILVQLTMYQAGQQVFEFFAAEPLIWKPSK